MISPNRITKSVLTLAFFVTFLTACSNDPAPEEALKLEAGFSDVKGVTLKVQQPAPNFSLTAMDGRKVSLSDFHGSGVLLIFYRGHWCPFCIGHLEDIQTLLPDLKKKGFKVIAISPDDVEGLQKMADRMKKPYTFLSDPKLVVADLYGVRKDKKLPHPAVVIIDKAGLVQWFYVGEDFKKRPSASQLKQVIDRLYPQ